MNEKFSKLDQTRAALRIIYLVMYGYEVTQTELANGLKKQGVGARALGSSLDTLHEIGLIKTESEIRDGTRVKITSLTKEGIKITKLVEKIYDALLE